LGKLEGLTTAATTLSLTHLCSASGKQTSLQVLNSEAVLEDVFIEIFPGVFSRFLDQLGMSAKYDTKSYCRQSLIGGNYGLLNTTTFQPNPDYYR